MGRKGRGKMVDFRLLNGEFFIIQKELREKKKMILSPALGLCLDFGSPVPIQFVDRNTFILPIATQQVNFCRFFIFK